MTASPSKKSFLLWMEKKRLDEIRSMAKEREISASQLLRDIIDEYIEGVVAPKPRPLPSRRQSHGGTRRQG